MRLLAAIALSVALSESVIAQPAPRRDMPAAVRRVRDLARREYSGDSARAVVARMERWWRWPGNPGYDSSVALVESILRRAGYVPERGARSSDRLVYRVESRPMKEPAWHPVDAELSIVGESAPLLRFATNRNMLAIESYSTPDTGVVAELVDAGRGGAAFDSVKVEGRIVLVAGGVSGGFNEAVRKRGALGVLAYAMPAYTQPEKNTASIQFQSIALDTARRSWGIPLSYGAYSSLRAALARGPVRVRVRVRTELLPSVERTVIAEVRGSARPDERFVLSAHLQEPGANDNASGVGSLAELARWAAGAVRRGTIDPRRTVTMIFGNE